MLGSVDITARAPSILNQDIHQIVLAGLNQWILEKNHSCQ